MSRLRALSMFYGIQMAVCDLYAKANNRAQEVISMQDIPQNAKEASIKALKGDEIIIKAGLKVLKNLCEKAVNDVNKRNKSSLN